MSQPKHDVYINNIPYQLSSYACATTDDLQGVVGTTQEGQTNLDFLKAETQKGWRGGSFQKTFDDPEMAGFISGMQTNPLDSLLYLTPNPSTVGVTGLNTIGIDDWCYWKNKLWIMFACDGTSSVTRKLVSITLTSSPSISIKTLPTELVQSSYPIRIAAYGNYMYLAPTTYSSSTASAHRYDGTTFTDVSGGFADFIEFRDKLYGVAHHNTLFQITNTTSTPIVYSSLKNIGAQDEDDFEAYQGSHVFNGALYIAMVHGLYRYDGVDLLPVIDMRKSASDQNFKFLSEYNGRLYWSTHNRIYEFDGVNIEMIQDLSDAYTIIDMCGSSDSLWVSVRYNQTSIGSYESDNFDENIPVDIYKYGLFRYNGIGIIEYCNETYTNDQGDGDYGNAVDYKIMPAGDYVFWLRPSPYFNSSMETKGDGFSAERLETSLDFSTDSLHTSQEGVIISSEFDMGYPSVDKVLNGIELDYETNDDYAVSIEVAALRDGTWQDWEEIWNTAENSNSITDGIGPDYYIYEQTDADTGLLTSPIRFQRIKYRMHVTCLNVDANTVPFRAKSLTLRYIVTPRVRRKWLLNLRIAGVDNSGYATDQLGDGSDSTYSASELRNNITHIMDNKEPVLFYDIHVNNLVEFGVAGAYDTVSVRDKFTRTPVTLAIQATMINPSTWSVQNARLSGYGDGIAQYYLLKHGFRTSMGAVGTDVTDYAEAGAEVRYAHTVYVKRIVNEQIILSDETANTDSNDATDYISEMTIEVIEV